MTVPVQTVQSSVVSGAASIVCTISASGSGNPLIVLCPVGPGSGAPTFALTDNESNTYVKRADSGNIANDQSMIFDCLSPIAGVTTITLTPTGGVVSGSITVIEWPTTLTADQHGSHTQATPANGPITATSTSVNTSANDVVFACMQEQGAGAGDNPTDPPATFTHLSVTTSGGINANECCYRINSSIVTDTASWTWSNGPTNASAAIASYTLPAVSTATIAWVS